MNRTPAPTIPEPVREVMEELIARGHEVALVGGFPRDTIRGAPVDDFDLTTDAESAQLLAAFARAVPIGHDTVMLPTRAGPIDITPYRGGGGLEADLGHRDFTVNAIAWSADRAAWVDPWDGRQDLDTRTLRPVGSLRERLAEDPLRALRAARFVATLRLEPQPGLAAEIAAIGPSFRGVAAERIRRELELLLLGASAGAGLALLRESGVEEALTPLPRDAPVRRWVDALPARLEIRLACWLLGSDPQVTLGPLRFGERRIAEVARRTARHPIDQVGGGVPSRGRLHHLLARTSRELVEDLVAMREAETGARLDTIRADLDAILCQERPVLGRADLALDGDEVMETLGLPPGRRVGHAIGYLLDRVLDDPTLNTAARLRACLKQWDREHP